MKLMITTLAAVAYLVLTVSANRHFRASCVKGIRWHGGGGYRDTNSTVCACDAYRTRDNHGNWNPWEYCSDCDIEQENWKYCKSPDRHIGGNEWNQYCIDCGADKGWADDA